MAVARTARRNSPSGKGTRVRGMGLTVGAVLVLGLGVAAPASAHPVEIVVKKQNECDDALVRLWVIEWLTSTLNDLPLVDGPPAPLPPYRIDSVDDVAKIGSAFVTWLLGQHLPLPFFFYDLDEFLHQFYSIGRVTLCET